MLQRPLPDGLHPWVMMPEELRVYPTTLSNWKIDVVLRMLVLEELETGKLEIVLRLLIVVASANTVKRWKNYPYPNTLVPNQPIAALLPSVTLTDHCSP